jgi:hypothetical protein
LFERFCGRGRTDAGVEILPVLLDGFNHFSARSPCSSQGKLGKKFLSREKRLPTRGSAYSLAPRLAELGACGLGQGFEGFLIMNRHVREDFAVELDLGFLQSIHKLTVVHAFCSYCGIYSGNPEPSKFSLAIFTVAIGIAQTMFHGLSGFAETSASHTSVTFG